MLKTVCRWTLLLVLPLLLAVLPLPTLAASPAEDAPAWDLTPLPESWFDDAVFIGDSVTVVLRQQCEEEGGLGNCQFVTEYSYGVRNAVDGVLPLWYRGLEYDLPSLLPATGAKKAFLMLGTNDLGREGGLEAAMYAWEMLTREISAVSPDIQLFIESQLPIWHETAFDDLNNACIEEYNERLRALCLERGYVFVDLADCFRDETGGLAEEYTADYYVHVNFTAAALWVQELRNPLHYSEDPRNYA